MNGIEQFVAIMWISTLMFIAIVFNISKVNEKGDGPEEDE